MLFQKASSVAETFLGNRAADFISKSCNSLNNPILINYVITFLVQL